MQQVLKKIAAVEGQKKHLQKIQKNVQKGLDATSSNIQTKKEIKRVNV